MRPVIFRAPLVYGPGVKANFLRLLELVQRDIPIPLATVKNRRSMIYLGNLVDLITVWIKNQKAAGQTYLAGDGEDISTPELIKRIAAAMGNQARLFPFPQHLLRIAGKLTGKSGEVSRLLDSLTVDTSNVQSELNWTAPFTMQQGLIETVHWFKKTK